MNEFKADWSVVPLEGSVDSRPDRFLAVIAFGRGKLLYWQGAGVEAEIESLGEDLIEYSVDDVPEYQGVYVWEGKLFCDKDYYGEYNQYLSGNWRQVTQKEWEAYLNDEYIWEIDERNSEMDIDNYAEVKEEELEIIEETKND